MLAGDQVHGQLPSPAERLTSAMEMSVDEKDYMEGARRLMQLDCADDYILSTGEAHTIREYVDRA